MTGYTAHMGDIRNAYKIFSDNLKGRDHMKDQGVGGRIILKSTLGKLGFEVWTGLIWTRTCDMIL